MAFRSTLCAFVIIVFIFLVATIRTTSRISDAAYSSLRDERESSAFPPHRPKKPPCSLNGSPLGHHVVGGEDECVCDAPWSGEDCSVMTFLPVEFPQGYGMTPNVTTWGGNVVRDLESGSGSYHIFVAAMTNGCPLRHWGKNSRVDHAVSEVGIGGPYRFRDVAINTWSHNPAVVRLSDGTYAIFHIGEGSGPPDGGVNCTAVRSDGGDDEEKEMNPDTTVARDDRLLLSKMEKRDVIDEEARETSGSTIHVSDSLDGPWTPLSPNSLGVCNNPAPFVHPVNGTIFVMCRGRTRRGVDELLRSDDISGPWTLVTTIEHDDGSGGGRRLHEGPRGSYEDPFLYIDRRGNFHVLYHVYNTTENPPHGHDCTRSTVSAHAYSEDGIVWHVSEEQPYGTAVELTSGETITVSTRERPKLFFDESGTMTHLINGVCAAPNCPDGPKTGCVNCKYDSADYTLIVPLDV